MISKRPANVRTERNRGVVKLKGEDLFSLWVKTACCNLDSKQLRKLADIADKYARSYLLFTTRQIPIIPFIHLKDVGTVEEELGTVYLRMDRCGPTVRNVNVCYEDKICPEAVSNPLSLAEKLDNFFHVPMPHKVKIGVAGCKQDCIISRVLTDIGFIALGQDDSQGYDAYVGGRLGVNPFVGVKMAGCLSEEECVRLVQNYFDLLLREGKKEERSADLITRLGAETVKGELNQNLGAGPALKPIKCQTGQQEKATEKMILRVRATCGEVTADQLRKIADIAEGYGGGFVHFAVRGSPEIPGIEKRHLEDIRKELQGAGMQILDGGIDNLQSCFGNYCPESNVDPQSLLGRIEELATGLDLNNLNITISASGCPNSCGIAHLNDIGFLGVVEPEVDAANCNGCQLCLPLCKRKAIEIVAGVVVIDEEKCKHCGQCITACPFDAIVDKRRGFAVLVGGQEGENARLGEVIAEFLSEEEALRITHRCLRILKEKNSSAAAIIDEVGIQKFRELLVPMAK
jgi:dissimilatory sulfite reductase (desulfoviridin) alpha/beta subunit